MKIYIKSSKQFYSIDNKVVDLERETKSLKYDHSYDGDYFKGQYHTDVVFIDSEGNECLIKKVYDTSNPDNPYNLEEGKQYQVSGYFVPQASGVGHKIYYEICQPRISGIKGNDGKEIVLKFTYPSTASKDAHKLCELLDNNNIEYKCYDVDGESGWPIEFKVLRSGKKWDDIMRLINSIRPSRYKREKLIVSREPDGELRFVEFV